MLLTDAGYVPTGFLGSRLELISFDGREVPTASFCDAVASLAVSDAPTRLFADGGLPMEFRYDSSHRAMRVETTERVYSVPLDQFTVFADYVLQGGFFGWDPERPGYRPPFVLAARKKVVEGIVAGETSLYLRDARHRELPSVIDDLLS